MLGKARLILEVLGAANTDLGLNELARRSGVPKATVHRLAGELVDWGVLERAERGYRLGARLFALGQRVPQHRIFREAALPFMEDLFYTAQESVYLCVRADLELLQIERFLGHRGVSSARVPNRSPLHSSASGKALLAYSDAEVIERTAAARLRPRTKFTITDPARLRAQLRAVYETGYASEREEQAIGYGAVAAPVFAGKDQLAGAMSIVAPADRFDTHRLASALLPATRALGRVLRDANPLA